MDETITAYANVDERTEFGDALDDSLNFLSHCKRLDDLTRGNIEGASILPHDVPAP
jgi:hypothetical protein